MPKELSYILKAYAYVPIYVPKLNVQQTCYEGLHSLHYKFKAM